MKKNTIILIVLILVVALVLGACFTPPNDDDNTTPPESGTPPTGNNPSETQKPDDTTPPPPKPITAKEAIELFLSSIENNFSASGEIKNNLDELLTGGQKYSISVDGNKIFTDNNGEKYYVEKLDGNEYVYLQQNNAWVKRLITEEDNYPSDMSIVTDLLDKVTWKSYNAATNFAEGQFKHENDDMWIECDIRSDGATVTIYKIQHMWLLGNKLIEIGNIEIYDVGSTTVKLPTNVVDET